MITFTRGSGQNSNTVEVNFGGEVHYISPEAPIKGKAGDNIVFIGEKIQLGNSGNFFRITTTEINGRPSDDAAAVAEWLRDTYFYGLASAGGGGSFPADYANSGNQTAMISELQDVEAAVLAGNTDIATIKDKMASAQVTENFDHKSIVYFPNGNINYVSYKLGGIGGTEVARLTYTYDANDNITEITKT